MTPARHPTSQASLRQSVTLMVFKNLDPPRGDVCDADTSNKCVIAGWSGSSEALGVPRKLIWDLHVREVAIIVPVVMCAISGVVVVFLLFKLVFEDLKAHGLDVNVGFDHWESGFDPETGLTYQDMKMLCELAPLPLGELKHVAVVDRCGCVEERCGIWRVCSLGYSLDRQVQTAFQDVSGYISSEKTSSTETNLPCFHNPVVVFDESLTGDLRREKFTEHGTPKPVHTSRHLLFTPNQVLEHINVSHV